MIALPKFRQIGCDVKAFVNPGSHSRQAYGSYISMIKALDLSPGLLHITRLGWIITSNVILTLHSSSADLSDGSKLAQNLHSFADDKGMGICYNCIVQ